MKVKIDASMLKILHAIFYSANHYLNVLHIDIHVYAIHYNLQQTSKQYANNKPASCEA